MVACVVALHVLWAGAFLAAGHEARDFVKIGTRFVLQGHSSTAIAFDPTYRYPPNHDSPNGFGFDGQWSYYLALDPAHAHDYLDLPAFRSVRILYPMAARALAWGRPALVPWTLIVVNLAAIAAGVAALAAWLRRRSCSPWLALLFGLYPGLLVSFQRDLTEPLAYALVAVAVLVLTSGGRRGWLGAGVLFGLAGLARQTAVVFPLCYAATVLLAGEGPRANAGRTLAFLALALGPLLAWMGVLWLWLGSPGASAPGNLAAPFTGVLDAGPWQLSRQPPEIAAVVVPALIVAGAGVAAWRVVGVRVELVCLLANVLLFVVLLGPNPYRSYTSSGRVAMGVVVASVHAVPSFAVLGRRGRAAVAVAAGLALCLWPVLAVYGFTDVRVGSGVI